MCDLQWNALAEFRLCNRDFPEEIYCLCSRVFTWSFEGTNEELNADEGDLTKKEESTTTESPNYNFPETTDSTTKHCVETEPLSCYCSASHTDNISTDEHDSLRDSHTNQRLLAPSNLHLSDSGADLTEYCNNSAWQKYWSLNGERLIWESWITKYSKYINPEYLQTSQDQQTDEDCSKNVSHGPRNQDKEERSHNVKFSFDSLSPRQDSSDCSVAVGSSLIDQAKDSFEQKLTPTSEIVEKNRMLIRNLSYSDSYDKLNREVEGWNPLSPVSNDCETEAERLLSSRCASRTGSSARTVDSMTNVTRMTISSIDLSENSKNSDSFSSVSSVQSSITSTSSEDAEEPVDHERQWSALWTKHYEEEYLEHYKKFIFDVGKSTESTDEAAESLHDCEENSGDGSTPRTSIDIDEEASKVSEKALRALTSTISEQTLVDTDKANIRRRRKRIKAKRGGSTEAIGLSAVFNLMKMEENLGKTSDSCKSDAEANLPACSANVTDVENKTEHELLTHVEIFEQINEMSRMGLPLSFKCKEDQVSAKSRPIKKPLSAKHSLEEDDSDQSSSNRIKAAFTLIGLEMHEGTEAKLKGCVDYKMKHIHKHNRGLKFRKNNDGVAKPKHTRFDEDGFVVPESSDSGEVTVQNSHQDELSGIIPSSSTEDEMEPVADEIYTQEMMKGEENQRTRRKRRRRLNLPPEIKDNQRLKKYWHRRYSLFSKFDQGIKLDEESWFSVTPELIAKNAAERCRCDVIIDAFCGAGGNTIQFAFTCNKVIAIDIDPKKIELAQQNADVYGVADHIEFIVGDFFQLADSLKADVVFLSPPWGGPQYLMQPTYDLNQLQPVPFTQLLSTARKITDNISVFLPKNSNTYPLVTAFGKGGRVEIEQNFLSSRLVAITAYYGDLVKNVPVDIDK